MSAKLNPYLNFTGNARQAIEFYETVFGGKLTMTTYKDGGMSSGPADENNVMHAQLDADNGMSLMASDSPPQMPVTVGNNISIGLSGNDEGALRGYWDKLSPGGTVTMPLEKAPWGDTFGMCIDKFGIGWLVNISGNQA